MHIDLTAREDHVKVLEGSVQDLMHSKQLLQLANEETRFVSFSTV